MITLDYKNKENVEVDSSLHNKSRSASAFRSKKEARRYWIVIH